jgi:Glycosyl hydrolase family 12
MQSRAALTMLAALGVAMGLTLLAPRTAQAMNTQLCGQFDNTRVSDGRYIVQNNEWNDSIRQCLHTTDDGFTVTSGYHDVPTDKAPSGYPSIFAGCHYGNCTAHSGLPLQVSDFGDPTTSVAFTRADAEYDASYDVWFDTQPYPSGQNNGAELMIWADVAGPLRPVGRQVGIAYLADAFWNVWEGPSDNGGVRWNVVSYVRQPKTTCLTVHLRDFTGDAMTRGFVSPAWFLTSVQFGFEPWRGGPGLGVKSFSFNANS